MLFGTDVGYMTEYDPDGGVCADGKGRNDVPSDSGVVDNGAGGTLRRVQAARTDRPGSAADLTVLETTRPRTSGPRGRPVHNS